jgi:glyoxylase-like metal-dependent hydrolase (beta-lactamase superfamily II)
VKDFGQQFRADGFSLLSILHSGNSGNRTSSGVLSSRRPRKTDCLLGRVLCKLFFHPNERLDSVAIDQPLTPGETLPVAGGFEVIHVPGHCAGQVALLRRPGRMLFAADVFTNILGLGDPVGFENLEEGRMSQRKLASLSFDAAGFGHGKPIARDASTRFRNKYAKHPEEVHQLRSAA